MFRVKEEADYTKSASLSRTLKEQNQPRNHTLDVLLHCSVARLIFLSTKVTEEQKYTIQYAKMFVVR